MPGSSKSAPRSRSTGKHRWSAKVTARSNALDLDRSVFTWTDPHRIALSLKRSAERSHRRKSDPYRSAMSMLTFYVNRAGKGLGARQRAVLERAKDELRKSFGKTNGKTSGKTSGKTARRTKRTSGKRASR
jgi:hypothetical protein